MAVEQEIERLTLEIARLINSTEGDERDDLRDFVTRLLREEVPNSETVLPEASPENAARFNPLGVGIPLLIVGGILLVVFPPVGLFMFGIAGLMVVWGILATLVPRRSARER